MLPRTAAAALLALAACVTAEDEAPIEGLPLDIPAAEYDRPPADQLTENPPVTPEGPRNLRPRPGLDQLATVEDVAVKVRIAELLANDVDPEGGRVVFASLGVASGGAPAIVDGHVVFTPEADFAGDAWFDYVISDGRLQATGRVKVVVEPQNDAPVAYPDRISVAPGVPAVFRLDTFDVDGDPLVIEVLSIPAHGALSGADDKYSYAAEPSFTGMDGMVFRVGDGAAWSEPVTVELEVMRAP
jgi:hypothetical protein